ncbi:MAG: hypothetical protein MUC96_16475 [Myxococcaceae bacterium]|nr:hypothetical protein [Myxococcaceae bacterium]
MRSTSLLLRFGLSALLGGLLVPACGPTRPPCSSTTCLGCCDSAGECRSGFDNSACGTRGNLCSSCGLGQSCVSGSCSQPNPGGVGGSGVGGGSFGGGAAGGSVGGGSAGGSAVRCDAANCGGCCDAQGQCLTGRSTGACGSNGAACLACSSGLSCNAFGSGGRCESGSGAGGGSAGGSAAGGGSPACGPQTCPGGCCTSLGQCQTSPTPAQCGVGGQACAACAARQTCVSGTCQACSGCINPGTGRCEPGTQTTACGRAGDFCTTCASGSSCSNQQCSTTPPSCNPSTCPSGCCDPQTGTCVGVSSQTAQRCGQGSAAALCVACTAQQRCDRVGAGSCVTASAPDGGGGLPGLDGGFPFPVGDGGVQFCLLGFQCAVGECCFSASGFGVCARIGNPNLLGGTTCGRSQDMCSATTCQTGQTCNAQVGVCQ